ncbi:MAG: hypothetical protein P8I27_00740 [Pirellulaceae bacterium]|nr:hypothetical protein [Pirellulaceae bacterium]
MEKQEPLQNWEHNPAYQQSPVDHFAADRLPQCSRKQAILLGLFLGFWGVQFFYLRHPGWGWLAVVVCKVPILLGLILAFFAGQPQLGLAIGIGGPVVAELAGMVTSIALQTGQINSDGKGNSLVA